MAANNNRNVFYSGPDRQPTGSFASYNPGGGGGAANDDSMQQQLQASRTRQLETQKRALQSLHSSEQMGVSTAEELVRQGEVLNRTEEKLDHIAEVQKDSQRHINSLTSVFGGIKNWWRGDSAKSRSGEQQQQQSRYEQPGRSLNGAMAASSSSQAKQQQQVQQQQQPSSGYDRDFDDNLGEMSSGVSRLKMLAAGLGGEIDRQNEQLERMGNKTDKNNAKMDQQNREMNRVLYGSKAPK